MTSKQIKSRLVVIYSMITDILWRSFGLAWYVVPTGMGVGSIPILNSDWFTGGMIAFATSFVIAARDMGREITLTANLNHADISRAFKKAVAQQEHIESPSTNPAPPVS